LVGDRQAGVVGGHREADRHLTVVLACFKTGSHWRLG
jgi:hypothetical protein